jgi:hypothetical protein
MHLLLIQPAELSHRRFRLQSELLKEAFLSFFHHNIKDNPCFFLLSLSDLYTLLWDLNPMLFDNKK